MSYGLRNSFVPTDLHRQHAGQRCHYEECSIDDDENRRQSDTVD